MRRSWLLRAAVGTLAAGLSPCAPAGESLQVPPAPGVTVVHSDARSMRLEIRPVFSERRVTAVQGRSFVLFDFAGSVRLNVEHNPGIPDLRFFAVPLAFPGASGSTVRVLAADYEDLAGDETPLIPALAVRNGMLEALPGLPPLAPAAAQGLFPASPAELVVTGEVRGTTVGHLRIFPVQADAAARSVRKYSRLVVEVVYGPPASGVLRRDDALLRTTVLNYDASRLWPSAQAKVAAASPSVLASGDWYRLSVTEDGLYRLDGAALAAAGITVSSLDPRTIKIYGNGGADLPENLFAPRPVDLVENAILVSGETDGKFDAGDYVLFYGASPRQWMYDRGARTYRHAINHYTETNYYWLTFGGQPGKRMQEQASAASAPVVVETFTDRVAIEEERVNILISGKDWYGQALSVTAPSFTHVTSLPGLVAGGSIFYRYALVAHSDVTSNFTIRENGAVIGTHALPAVYGYQYATAGTFQSTGTSSLPGNTSRLTVSLGTSSSAADGWIDWIEVHYPRQLWALNGALIFRSPDTTATIEYRLQQFTSLPVVLNITDPANARVFTGVSGSYVVRATETSGTPSVYLAAVSSGWKAPAAIQKMANENLRGFSTGADFIIVTTSALRAAAERLRAHREQAAFGDLRTAVVDIQQIYNEFGGGLPDITALRDFLKYAYDNWTRKPTFVLLFGQASYSYKSTGSGTSSAVPTWQSVESRHEVDTYATDDYFAKFGSGDNISLVLGRINARSVREGEAAVDKLIRYDVSSAKDNWSMRMLLIGDDAWTPEGGEFGDRTTHSDDAETLAQPYYTPDEFEKIKIFLAEYPTVNAAAGRRKPGAYQAIIDNINRGVLLVNFSGHGNPTVWTHERVFDVGTSIPLLRNANRLPVYILATCNFSQFDDPSSVTGSELLLNRAEGGGVGVISASRKVYAGANAALNQGMALRMFTRDAYGRVVVERPATALFLYKSTGQNIDNDQKFFYMGDPTTRLQYPRGYAVIDSINGEPVDSVRGGVRTTPIQLRSLSRVSVSGTVRNGGNSIDPSFAGTLTLQVNDVTRLVVIPDFYPGMNWTYHGTGGTIYRGENSVRNGRFNATFVVPKDIAYADTLGRGRLVAFVAGASSAGAGYTGNIRIGGTDSTAAADTHGPALRVYLDSRSFRTGDLVGDHPTLLVDISDSGGVNTSRTGVGHGIEAWLNAGTQSIDLTDAYTSALDDYRSGTVQYALSGLPQGHNVIRVRAWDSYNNSATAEASFDVATSEKLTITDVFNYPNPFADGTAFTFRQNQTGLVNVTVKIYTIRGRLIRTLTAATSGSSFIRIPWDGRDTEGDLPANGVYLYKVIAQTADGRFSSEALGKLTKMR